MANLKSIRKRISSVKGTQKLTRAMKMVAAARLNRAQQRILAIRPYAVKAGIAGRSRGESGDAEIGAAETSATALRFVLLKTTCSLLTSNRGMRPSTRTSCACRAPCTSVSGRSKFSSPDRPQGREYLKRRNRRLSVLHMSGNAWLSSRLSPYPAPLDSPSPRRSTYYLIYNEFRAL